MKRLIFAMIVAGTAIGSSIGIMFLGCSSSGQLGGPSAGNSGSQGGNAGALTIKLDGNVPGQGQGQGGEPGSGPLPTKDMNCGSQTSGTSQEPADVLLVLDRSGSMNESIAEDCCCSRDCGNSTGSSLCASTSNCTERWPALTSAVNATLTSTPGIRWGLKLFSSPTGGGRQAACNVNSGVEVQIGDNSAASIQTQIASVTPANNTPTAAAIKAATAYLEKVTDQNNKVILLATDGQPNCPADGNSSDSDVPGTTKAIQDALTAGFKVYVIGIGPLVGNLDGFAQAGGTSKYYPATSPQDLANALAAISQKVATCTFSLNQTPSGDSSNIAVYLDKNLVPKDPSNGWSFGASSQIIVLNGTTCDKITSEATSTVQVLFGCPGTDASVIIP